MMKVNALALLSTAALSAAIPASGAAFPQRVSNMMTLRSYDSTTMSTVGSFIVDENGYVFVWSSTEAGIPDGNSVVAPAGQTNCTAGTPAGCLVRRGLGNEVFTSTFGATIAGLQAADSFCHDTGSICLLDRSYQLASNLTLTGKWRGIGGILTRNSHAISGDLSAAPNVQMFDVAGTGTVSFLGSAPISLGWFSTGTPDDTEALQSAAASALASSQRSLIIPQGVWTTNTCWNISGISIYGNGLYASRIKASSSLTDCVVKLEAWDGGPNANSQVLENFQIDASAETNNHAHWNLRFKGNVLDVTTRNLLLSNPYTGCWRFSTTEASTTNHPSIITNINDSCRITNTSNTQGPSTIGVQLDAGQNIGFDGLDIEGLNGHGVNITASEYGVGPVKFSNMWLEAVGRAGYDAVRCAGGGNGIIFENSTIINYGNTSAGDGINFVQCNNIRNSFTTPSAPNAAGAHRITIGAVNGYTEEGFGCPYTYVATGNRAVDLRDCRPSASVFVGGGDQVIATPGTRQVVIFDRANWDATSMCNLSTSRCTFSVPGTYRVIVHLTVNGTTGPVTGGTLAEAAIRLTNSNGSKYYGILSVTAQAGALAAPSYGAEVAADVHGDVGDYVEGLVNSEDSDPKIVALAHRSYMTVDWIGP